MIAHRPPFGRPVLRTPGSARLWHRQRGRRGRSVLNAARQAGGALGVALLTGAGPGGHGLALQVPLTVAAGSLLAAVGLAWVATRPG
jgi:hypothetical protein